MDTSKNQLVGKLLGTHHKVLKVLGEGTFSVVMSCCNLATKKIEAVKMFRQCADVAKVAQREINVLEGLRRLDPDKSNIISWTGSFATEWLTWISFELLDQDLRSYMMSKSQITGTRALVVSEVRPVLHQLATALFYLKTIGIIHADLKPNNILCAEGNQQPLRVKLADFGLSQFLDGTELALPVQTLCYRAPEVLVGSPYNEAIDMWSLGATAAELVMGRYLYGVSNEYDALRSIIEVQGQPPDYLMDRGKFSHYYFQKGKNTLPLWTLKSPEVFQEQTGHHPEKELQLFRCLYDILTVMEEAHGPQEGQYLLVDLVSKMLRLDPRDRMDPTEALNHKFFSENIPPSNVKQEDVQKKGQRAVQLKNTAHIQKDILNQIKTGNCGPVQTHINGYHQMVNWEYAQQAVPAFGQNRPWTPGYYQGNHHFLPFYGPVNYAYVHPGISAYNQMYNYMYVPGYYNI